MSMTYADILILLKAGYTKDEINNMEAPADPQALLLSPGAVVQPSGAAASESSSSESLPQESVPAPEVGDPEPAPQDPTQQILMQLTELVKSVQANNRSMAEMGAEIIEPRQQAINTLKSLGGIPDNN